MGCCIGFRFGLENGSGKWAMMGWNWSWAKRNGLGQNEMGLGGARGGMSSDFLQFCSEHPSMFWLSFLPRMSDRCKINFFKKYTSTPFQPYMARFLIQSQKIMVNFSITDFCSILAARPPCSKSDAAPSRKMIKIQGKWFQKLDSYIFPTIYGTFLSPLYHSS